MGKYPVISLSLKSMKQASYSEAITIFKKIISDEFKRHSDVLLSDKLNPADKLEFEKVCNDAVDKSFICIVSSFYQIAYVKLTTRM